MHGAAESLDHHPAVRLRVVRSADLPHLALEAEHRAGHRQRRAPLPGAGLGGQPAYALLGVVERLRHRGIRLVAAGRADALVLVVDVRRRAERLLEPVRPVQAARAATAGRSRGPPRGCRTYRSVVTSCRISVHREERREIGGPDRLTRRRMQVRRRRGGQVGDQVVPVRRQLRTRRAGTWWDWS